MPLQELELTLQQRIGGVVLGVSPAIRAWCIAVVARGHVLVQGVPGLGKTLLGEVPGRDAGRERFKRIQGTSDLMPTDITGTHLFDRAANAFVFRPGPLFADVVLFDEVNRAGPRTQSALLEAMEERQVSRRPGTVRAAGGLPGDRHAEPTRVRGHLSAAGVAAGSLHAAPGPDLSGPRCRKRGAAALHRRRCRAGAARRLHPVPAGLVAAAREAAGQVHASAQLCAYVLALARASREHAQLSLGLSTRGALALLRAARILAGIQGAQFVSADEVKAVAPLVIPHRLMLTGDAMLADVTEHDLVTRILEQVPAPR